MICPRFGPIAGRSLRKIFVFKLLIDCQDTPGRQGVQLSSTVTVEWLFVESLLEGHIQTSITSVISIPGTTQDPSLGYLLAWSKLAADRDDPRCLRPSLMADKK